MNSRFYSQDRCKLKHMISHVKVLTDNLEKLTAEISTLKNGWITDQSQNRVTKEKEFTVHVEGTCNKPDTFWVKSINVIQGFLRKLYFRTTSKQNITICSNTGQLLQSNCVVEDKKSTARSAFPRRASTSITTKNKKNEKKNQCCQTFLQPTRSITKNVSTSSETRIPRKCVANYYLLSSNSVDYSTNRDSNFQGERISLDKCVQTTLLRSTVGHFRRRRVINKRDKYIADLSRNGIKTHKNKLKEKRRDYVNDSSKLNFQGNCEYLNLTHQPFCSRTSSSDLQCEKFAEGNIFSSDTDDEQSFSTSTLSVNLQFSVCSSTVPSSSSANRIPKRGESYILRNNDSIEETQVSPFRNQTPSVTNGTLQHKYNNLNAFKKLGSKGKTSNERLSRKGVLPKIILLKCKKSRSHAWYKTRSYLYYSGTSSSSSQTSSNTIMNCKTSKLGCKIK